MKIGTLLRVKALVEPEYDSQGYRWITGRIICPEIAWYVGYTFKQEGKYDPGYTGRTLMRLDEPPEYEPPMLVPEKFIKVYRIRFHERGKEHYCFPEDAEVMEE